MFFLTFCTKINYYDRLTDNTISEKFIISSIGDVHTLIENKIVSWEDWSLLFFKLLNPLIWVSASVSIKGIFLLL